MDKKSKKSLIEWYLDFIRADLKRMSDSDKIKLAFEVSKQILGRPSEIIGVQPTAIRDDLLQEISPNFVKYIKELGSLQKGLKDFMGTIFLNAQWAMNSVPQEWTPAESVSFNQSINRFKAEIEVELEAGNFNYERKEEGEKGKTKKYYKGKKDAVKNASVALRIGGEKGNKEDILKFNFARLLEGVPLKAFKRCSECEGFFIHLTERERFFCSNQCAARNGARKKRMTKKKEAPEAYKSDLKAGAKRARKSYIKKIRETHPSAIPDRRPRKHKE
jgi:hypothetical protein